MIRPPGELAGGQAQTVRLAVDPSREGATLVHPRPVEPSLTNTPSLSPVLQPTPSQPRGVRSGARPRPAAVPPQVHMTWMLVTFAAAVAAFVLGLLVGSRLHVVRAPGAPPAVAPEK